MAVVFFLCVFLTPYRAETLAKSVQLDKAGFFHVHCIDQAFALVAKDTG